MEVDQEDTSISQSKQQEQQNIPFSSTQPSKDVVETNHPNPTTSRKDSNASRSSQHQQHQLGDEQNLHIINGIAIVPFEYHACPGSIIIRMTVDMLQRLIYHNDKIPLTNTNLTRFHSRAPPSISLSNYLTRIVKYANVEPCVLILILIYVDRICSRHPHFTISSLTVHRFIISAVTVGAKSLSDIYCTNTYFARVGGVSAQELNVMEVEFCLMMDWNLVVHETAMRDYYLNLVRMSPYLSLERSSDEFSDDLMGSSTDGEPSPENRGVSSMMK